MYSAGHLKAGSTTWRLREKFFWPKMAKMIHEYVKTCDICQTTSRTTLKPPGLLQPLPVPQRRWASISIDFMGKLPRTARKHDFLLVVVDRFTKRVRLLFSQVFAIHGFPTSIVSDRDTRFTSKIYQELFRSVTISLKIASTGHAQTDGQTERANRMINGIIRSFTNRNGTNWDELLPMVEFAINSAPSSATGYSPFEADLGYQPTGLGDLAMNQVVVIRHQG